MNYRMVLKNISFVILFSLMTIGGTSNVVGESTLDAKNLFSSKFIPLKETVIDENAFFSMSKMTKELSALFPLAKRIGEDSQELLDLYDIYTLVQSKKPEKSKEVIKYSNEALEKYKNSKLLKEKMRAWLHFRLTNAYQEEGEFPNAIKHQKLFISLALKSKLMPTESTALGQKEQLAYLLHSNKQYLEALQVNLEVLKGAKKANVAEDKYFNLYNNLAQNYYELKDFSNTKAYLNKRLLLSKKYENFEAELNTLFQLAVLAFEEKRFDESKQLFKKRIELAKTKKDLLEYSTLEGMEEDLETYYEKLDKKQKWSL